jgi:hypothetical protein
MFRSSLRSPWLWLPAVACLLAAGSSRAGEYEPPRTADGHPDLSGVWTNASLTTLTRPAQIKDLVLTPEQADALARGNFHNVRAAKEQQLSDPNRGAPEKAESLPGVGNYNASWVEPGTTYARVKGEIRSSWIVEPADGRIPFRSGARRGGRGEAGGAGSEEERGAASPAASPAAGGAAGAEAGAAAGGGRRRERTDPETMSLGERCLLGFGGTAGPPMLNVLYNNYYQIVQTPENVMILVEMVHDARMVRMNAQHGPLPRWLGDSIGRWDGDTLVIETTGFHPARARSGPFYYSKQAKVTERVTRVDDRSLLYEFTVEDPENYTGPIRGEMSFARVDSQLYEYACHEGNYAMTNVLSGARLMEKERAAAQGKGQRKPAGSRAKGAGSSRPE